MIQEFQQHIKCKLPFLEKGKCLLTISGGIDSVVLAYLCKSSQLHFSLAHCNFNLRGEESDADEVFIKQLAEQLEVEVFTQSFQTELYAKDHQTLIRQWKKDYSPEDFSKLPVTKVVLVQ